MQVEGIASLTAGPEIFQIPGSLPVQGERELSGRTRASLERAHTVI